MTDEAGPAETRGEIPGPWKGTLTAHVLLGAWSVLAIGVVFRGDAALPIAGALVLVAVLTPALARALRRNNRRWLRIMTCLLAAWIGMLGVVVLAMTLAEDPFAAARIAEKGRLVYFLVDRVVRGLFFGVLFGTPAFSWAWIPAGLIAYATLGRKTGA